MSQTPYTVKLSPNSNHGDNQDQESNIKLLEQTLFNKIKCVSYEWGPIEILDVSEKNIES